LHDGKEEDKNSHAIRKSLVCFGAIFLSNESSLGY